MQNDHWQQVATTMMFLFCLVGPVSLAAQNRQSNTYPGSYYYQAYDQGFRAGQSDYTAGRPYGYHAALVMTAGVAGLSQDYRNAFKLGYQDGYAPNRHGSDWYYRHHRHDSDCDEDDDRGNGNWSCRERHDNGKHKGWYKHHKHDHDEDDD
jgi:hypothetical protein